MSRDIPFGQCPYCGGAFYMGHECLFLREERKKREEIKNYQRLVQKGLKFSQHGDKE